MENSLLIQSLTKQEFKSIIEDIIELKISSLKKSKTPENLTVQSCSKLLSVSKLTIYNYIKKGIIPATRIGRKYVIKTEDVQNALIEVKSLKHRRYE